ncbi:hypothetical protein EJ08DRAFT_77846 [Tothia fuscella]|uniref:Uncharacterized protein n=1 Tax=Tothia fuscella TaxID=1048955 RepID=A0A9P4NW48_9PEZI|nr:hypothetical protein EJ08DRAFT_77846 [Tothia fuscella]
MTGTARCVCGDKHRCTHAPGDMIPFPHHRFRRHQNPMYAYEDMNPFFPEDPPCCDWCMLWREVGGPDMIIGRDGELEDLYERIHRRFQDAMWQGNLRNIPWNMVLRFAEHLRRNHRSIHSREMAMLVEDMVDSRPRHGRVAPIMGGRMLHERMFLDDGFDPRLGRRGGRGYRAQRMLGYW